MQDELCGLWSKQQCQALTLGAGWLLVKRSGSIFWQGIPQQLATQLGRCRTGKAQPRLAYAVLGPGNHYFLKVLKGDDE